MAAFISTPPHSIVIPDMNTLSDYSLSRSRKFVHHHDFKTSFVEYWGTGVEYPQTGEVDEYHKSRIDFLLPGRSSGAP
jgi:hypothetical protein